MRILFMLVLFVGLGLAGGAVYMAQKYIGQNRAELEAERNARLAMTPMVDVFVVKRTLRYGEEINKKDVTIVRYPENALPEGIFRDPAVLFPEGEARLRMARRDIEKFEPLTQVKVTEPGQVPGVTSVLQPGERAFAIRVDVTSGVSGFLRPGDNVDIYWTGNIGNRKITKLIYNGVRIIAIDQSINPEVSKARIASTVTVAVSPKDVAALQQAQSAGRLSLSLVGVSNDVAASEDVEVDLKDVLGIEEKVVAEVAKERVCKVKSRRGTEIVETVVDCPEE